MPEQLLVPIAVIDLEHAHKCTSSYTEKRSRMVSFFDEGSNASGTPMMARGDEKSVEETKQVDPSLVNASVTGETVNPHGDSGCGGITQAITQDQHYDADKTQDLDAENLDHMLVHVLDKDKLHAHD